MEWYYGSMSFSWVNWSHIREPLSQKWGFYCRKSEVKNNLKLYFFQNNVQRKEIGSWEISRNYYWEILEFRKDWSDPIIQNNWIVNEHAKIKKPYASRKICVFSRYRWFCCIVLKNHFYSCRHNKLYRFRWLLGVVYSTKSRSFFCQDDRKAWNIECIGDDPNTFEWSNKNFKKFYPKFTVKRHYYPC